MTDVDQAGAPREFLMTDSDFATIAKVAYELTGITLGDHKKNMIYGRLARRVRALGMHSFASYCSLIQQSGHEEIPHFINSITTNLTAFFREMHHFEFLTNTVCPELIRKNSATRRVRVWSAGCSTGEEPYSIAMTLADHLPVKSWDIKILATDLDTNVVDHGKTGIYRNDRVVGINESYQKRWLLTSPGRDQVKIKPELKEFITFKPLNLLHEWPMKGPFDVIFCRNVVIYFDKATQRALFDRYADILKPDGYLFIGHSETLHNVTSRFRSLGKTIYQRIK